MSIVNQIVDRCSVHDSDIAVYKYFRSRMNNKFLRKLPVHERNAKVREVMVLAMQAHHENQALYVRVMKGR